MDQQKLVDAQFGVAAMDYLQSPTHAQGADLQRLRALADGQRDWRVLQPEGRLVVIDAIAPETPLLDTPLQSIEVLRDASHVRDYRYSEWEAMLVLAGFMVSDQQAWKLPLCFESWIGRMRTPELRVAAIRSLCAAAATEVRDYFAIQPNNDCAIDAAWIEAVPACLTRSVGGPETTIF
ncbi:MAG: hypothetical protein ACYDDR_10630 [Acidithiobacillus ferrivorans]